MQITTLGFDADDTLWQNERFFRDAQDHVMGLLADLGPRADLEACLLAAERRNITLYGYGVKGFTLSLIETAIEQSHGKIGGAVIAEIMAVGRDLLDHPVELLPHAQEVVCALAQSHRLVLITKGDLLHQERKLAQSGLAEYFHGIEIVSEKRPETYRRLFDRHGDGAARAVMVGNSVKSDVLPAIAAGAVGAHVPHGLVWELERAEAPEDHPRYHLLTNLRDFADLVRALG